ncbi:MAG: insulinase family protein [Deltaproteobacteria bacterium]|nr:insulinase family protein [Deltaproteobacteria bacterium]
MKSPDVLHLEPRRTTLDNGLRVVTMELPHLHAALVSVYVRSGSRHEDARTNGVSHFLEHLFFRGSEGNPIGRVMNAMVEDVGGDLNGVTTRDHGYYFSPVHPSKLEVPLSVLGDMLARPLFKEIDVEREVILEEILDEVDEDGRDIDVDNLAKQALFGEHPLAMKIGGTRDTVAALREDDLRAHHARAYGAKNMVLSFAGPVPHEQVVEVARRAFKHLPEGAALDDGPVPALHASGPKLIAVDHKESQTSLQLSFPAVPEHHADFAALRVIKRALSDGLASRLQLELVESRGLAYSVGAGMDGFTDVSMFDVGASCAPKKAPALADEILRILAEVCEGGISETELVRAKLKSRIGLEFMLDSPAEMLGWYGLGDLQRPPAEPFAVWLERIEGVTLADVIRVARSTFTKRGLVSCVVGPLAGVEKKLRASLEAASGLP